MKNVSLVRLYVLRAMYLLIVCGLGATLWPGLLRSHNQWGLMEGVSSCMLAAFSLLCLVGLHSPVRMLPILLWEVAWKTIWLLLVPFPQWRAGHIQEAIKPTIFATSMVILVYLAIPWRYVFATYLRTPGDRWR